MDFDNWLLQTKTDEPDLEGFITKLEGFFSTTGFKASEFERRVKLGLEKIEEDIDTLLKPELDVED